ncbi:MAG: DUF2132 domain-containing protein [Saccharospirillaceae bacterium]|nr:DUF2132 domain-containing protein [Saccharospirillaceae bacterium]
MSDQNEPKSTPEGNTETNAAKEPEINKAEQRKINKAKQPANDPLHGVRLDRIITELTKQYDWDTLAKKIPLNCFKSNQSLKSSLKFLRATPWARQKVETLWVWTFVDKNYIPPSSERSKVFLEKQKQKKAAQGFNPWTDKK